MHENGVSVHLTIHLPTNYAPSVCEQWRRSLVRNCIKRNLI